MSKDSWMRRAPVTHCSLADINMLTKRSAVALLATYQLCLRFPTSTVTWNDGPLAPAASQPQSRTTALTSTRGREPQARGGAGGGGEGVCGGRDAWTSGRAHMALAGSRSSSQPSSVPPPLLSSLQRAWNQRSSPILVAPP
eukprot:758577-Hanusia_phi.AAC.4